MASKLQFDKLDKTNCVWGRIPAPGRSGDGYKYLGDFDTYEQCAASANIDPNAKAITHHGTKSGGYSRQLETRNNSHTSMSSSLPSKGKARSAFQRASRLMLGSSLTFW